MKRCGTRGCLSGVYITTLWLKWRGCQSSMTIVNDKDNDKGTLSSLTAILLYCYCYCWCWYGCCGACKGVESSRVESTSSIIPHTTHYHHHTDGRYGEEFCDAMRCDTYVSTVCVFDSLFLSPFVFVYKKQVEGRTVWRLPRLDSTRLSGEEWDTRLLTNSNRTQSKYQQRRPLLQ